MIQRPVEDKTMPRENIMSVNGRTIRSLGWLLAGLWLAAAGLSACKQEAASTPGRPLPEVKVLTVSARTIPDEPEFIGQTESRGRSRSVPR